VLALLIGVALFSRFGLDEELRRDEAIYAYGGQQLAEGVPPYVSILDPKTPLATFLSGGAVIIGRAAGVDDLYAIRLAFFGLACLTVLAVYLAGMALFKSPLVGLVAAATFATFKGFAIDALGGPNAKTPGILFAVLATALLVRRRWFWAGFASSLALLVWQPLAIYVLVAVAAAWLGSERDERVRHALHAVAGAAIPGLAVLVYFLAAGALGPFIEGALLLPLTGTERGETTLLGRIGHIASIVASEYGFSAIFFWSGLFMLLLLAGHRVWRERARPGALAREPLITVILPPLLFITAFSLVDFQGYPDAYPFLPLAALGVAGGVAAGLGFLEVRGVRPAAVALASAGTVALVVATWASYSQPRPEADALVAQRMQAAVAEQILGEEGTVYALGNSAPIVLMQRTNPSPNIYLAAGLDQWVIDHTPGGFDGWTNQIAAGTPDMVISNGWTGGYAARMRDWLRAQYSIVRIGGDPFFVTPELRERAVSAGVAASPR
jgi:hypothetical protein